MMLAAVGNTVNSLPKLQRPPTPTDAYDCDNGSCYEFLLIFFIRRPGSSMREIYLIMRDYYLPLCNYDLIEFTEI